MSLADYQTIVTDLVRDDAGKITAGQRDRAIAQALARLSAERPRQVAEDIADASGALVATPPGWVVGESSLVSVETPIGEVPPVLVVGVTVLAQPDGTERLAFSSPLAAGTAIRVRYSLLHLIDSQRDTVPAPLQWGVAALAASMLCGQLAALYANQGDSTIAADSVDQKSRSELYAARERELERKSFASWGLALPSATGSSNAAAGDAAGAVVSFESRRGDEDRRKARIWRY
jgi:hypothetical protein